MTNADTLTVLSYARECANATHQDCTAEQIASTLSKSNTEIAEMYLMDTGDDVTVSSEQREVFGAEYRSELNALKD